MLKRISLVLLVLVALSPALFSASPANAGTACNSYDSGIAYYENYGWVCGGHGAGCTECYDIDTGGSCTTTGDSCTPGALTDTPNP